MMFMELCKIYKSRKRNIPIAFLLVLIGVNIAWSRGISEITFEKKCSTCHSLQRARKSKKTKEVWKRRVKKCAKKTMEWENHAEWINEKDVKSITKYLISTQLIEKTKPLISRGGSRGKFKVNENYIKTAGDPENLSSIERIHIPMFILPKVIFSREKFKISVKISERTHPMLEEHYIQWIELYQDKILVKKFELSTGQREARVTALLSIGNLTDLRAVVKCNKHGLWESRKHIKAR